MKALLVLAAVAGTAYVGYSYNATDGESCLVCPMTGEPLLTSAEPEAASCCQSGAEAMLTGIEGEAATCCSKAKSSCCSKGDAEAMLTSVSDVECHGDCEKDCCKDKTDAVDVTSGRDETITEVEAIAEVSKTE